MPRAEIDERCRAGREACGQLLERVEALREQNPMLGLRGVRLGIHMPELTAHAGARDLRGRLRLRGDGVDVTPRS
jgi:pyruvate,orthophosphate dikinase